MNPNNNQTCKVIVYTHGSVNHAFNNLRPSKHHHFDCGYNIHIYFSGFTRIINLILLNSNNCTFRFG